MSLAQRCYVCYQPIELGAVLSHGQLHCSFACAVETGRKMWRGAQQLVIDVAPGPRPRYSRRRVTESA